MPAIEITKNGLTKIDEAYLRYKAKPSIETYDSLGICLQEFIQGSIAKNFGSRYDELQDAVGETVIEVLKDLPTFNSSKGNFGGWVYGIVFHTCLDMRRKKIRRHEERLIGNESLIPQFRTDEKLSLDNLKLDLTEEEVTLLDLKLSGFSFKLLAEKLGITENAVECRWRRLQEKLRVYAI